MGTALRYSLLWASTVFVSSCGSLLPSERAEVQSPFVDYLDAELRYSQAQPGSTRSPPRTCRCRSSSPAWLRQASKRGLFT